MYRGFSILGIIVRILKYSSTENVHKEDVRVPFGAQMCVEWCRSLGRCHSPIFDIRALSCRVEKTTFILRENSSDVYQLSSNKKMVTDCNLQKRIIRTRKSRLIWVPDVVQSGMLPSMTVYSRTTLSQYNHKEDVWERRQRPDSLFQISICASSSRVYSLFTWPSHSTIGYYESITLEGLTVLQRIDGQASGPPIIAVDEWSGLIFFMSPRMSGGKMRCRFLVCKDREVIRKVIMNIKLSGHAAINRKDKKLYLPILVGSGRYMVEADYEGRTGTTVKLPVEDYVRCTTYDDRDDVVFVLAGAVYRIDFNIGSAEEERFAISINPCVILVTCNAFVLLAKERGLVFDRNNLQGPVTEIKGLYGQRGVIFEHV